MANIEDLNEAWAGHSGLEVETFLKAQLTALSAALGGKFGHVEFNSQTMTITFYDEPGGTVLGTVQLGGQIYTIAVACNLSQVFYVLADETTKVMTITPSTTVSSFGSSTQEPFPEPYTYVVAVNSGAGYIDRVTGTIETGGSASFDIKPYLSTGDNYIRVSVTGTSSGQTKTTVFTGTLTTLTMSCSHTWQNVWTEGQDYNIVNIRFAGNLIKQLHVSLDDVELTPVTYSANQSYTTTSTYYTIPASAFPSGGSAVHSVKLWMSAQGVSTPQISFNIMCAANGDTTPLVAINAITPTAYNFTNGTIFSYAVYNANKVAINLSATLNSIVYPIVTGAEEIGREAGFQYPFAYSLEVDTGANETKIGSLAIAAKAYMDSTEGVTSTASTIFDNTYSYLATPGALFYLNAATRNNGTADYLDIVNEAGASENFAADYSAVWSGLSWYNDGWATDPNGYKALSVPAGCTCTFGSGENSGGNTVNFAPLALLSAYDGLTVEMMLMCGSPSDYSEPVFTISSGGATPLGIVIYPTRIVVWGSSERDEDYQSINFSENAMTHICVTILKSYEGQSGKNLCSVYINGISNVNFEFDGQSSFGNGTLVIGQSHTDAYLYKLRVYGSALESGAVFNNFLNCVVDGVEFNRAKLNKDNDVLLGTAVNYDLVKAAGFNTMVVITPNDVPIPDFYNQDAIDGCTVRFEYAGQTAKNATVGNVSMDGQGTTSKKYNRWNLRWKTSDNTTWVYGDGTVGQQGKKGRMINDTDYIIVDRITAKKNIASSPQGHKMGLTGLYNDLFHQIGLDAELPDPDYRVAVYQFPFIGFQYNSNNQSYSFIGVYTAGPDKGSKETFGYIKNTYPDCLSIEGPNHAPRGTRFLCPWVDVTYNPEKEGIYFGGEEGWSCDHVKWETSTKGTQADWDNILNLYNTEWQPAYNCVYDNSPYLASYQEVINDLNNPNITTLADLLTTANASTVKGGTTNGMILKNEYIAFYDSSYDLYFYRRSTGKFEKLPNDYAGKKNALTDLTAYLSALGYSTSSPTTAQIIEARAARFKATMTNYFSEAQTLYHYCFCLLYGVTDNFAKNSYPFKFQKLTTTGAGNRWGWRQDDLDSVLMTDNNGTNTKKYSVEHLDTFDGTQIFQGGDSALWMLIKANYESECRTMMGQISSAANSLAAALGVPGGSDHANLFNLTSYYCWDHSAKYFPATIYESDRRWSYIEPWLMAGQVNPAGGTYPATYNGVAPLTQALGDQYQGEKLWMERRIAYMFSKYHICEFSGTNTGYNAIVFTLADDFEFTLTPAIDLYPVVSLVNDDALGGRTPAGTPTSIGISTTGDSNNSIHGGDWLASLGDLSGMRLTSRGGSSSIPFSVTGARLQTLKIGDAVAGNVLFNATVFGVTSPTLVTLDARNTTTIGNNVDLLGCPRLRTCLFAGSGASGLLLPVGAKLTEVSFPDNASTVFLHTLPFLALSGLTLPALAGIVNLYINNCAQLNPFTIVASILETTGNTLAYATLIWSGVTTGNYATIIGLTHIAGSVTFENNTPGTLAGKADVEGTVQIPGLYADELDNLDIISEETYQTTLKKALSGLFDTPFYIIYDPVSMGIRFQDANVESICLTNWDTNHDNMLSIAEAEAVTTLNSVFKNNTTIQYFNEFKYFTGISSITTGTAFTGCTALKEISLPEGLVNLGTADTSGSGAFQGCSNLERISIPKTFRRTRTYDFTGCSKLYRIDITDISEYLNITWGPNNNSSGHPFYANPSGNTDVYLNGEVLTTVVIPSGRTSISHLAFNRASSLISVTFPNSLTSIGFSAFLGCANLEGLNLNKVQSVGTNAFSYAFRSVDNPTINLGTALKTIGDSAFSSCTSIKSLTFPASLEEIKQSAFSGCSALTTLVFSHPATSLTIRASSFNGTAITAFHFPDVFTLIDITWANVVANFPWTSTNANNGTQYHEIYIAGQRITSFEFPAGTTYIKACVLAGANSITSVAIPSTVTGIGNYAFMNMWTLRNLAIPCSINNSVIGRCGYSQAPGTLTINGNLSATEQTMTYHNFKVIKVSGGISFSTNNNLNVTNSECAEVVRIGGNWSGRSGCSLTNRTGGTKIHFIELLGDYLNATGNLVSANGVNSCALGTVIHLGKSTPVSATRATITSTATSTINNIRKIYVGTGESQAADEATLAQYLETSDWASYSFKLDTWWNYKQIARLPDAYKRLEYLWADDTQSYIDTGVPGNNENLKLQLGVIVIAHSNYAGIVGNYVNEGSDCWRIMGGTANTQVYGNSNNIAGGGAMGRTESSSILNRHLDIELSRNSLKVNGAVSTGTTNHGAVNNTNILLGKNGVSTGISQKRIYYFKVYDDGVLIRDYAPCVRLSDSVVGFYDTVNNTFQPSAGSTAFRNGYDFVYYDD